jgi:uncharacterized protein YjdB
MKYVEGRGLDSIIAEEGPLPVKMVQTILTQVGGALGYAHRRGVVHRDVKPANIMIDTEGWAVVTDFGIAKVAEAGSLTMSGATVGTPYYMSPEQCTARSVTGASDQYSLGIVAFEMLTGRPPFVGDSLMDIMRKHFFEAPPSLQQLRQDCPPLLVSAITRMLAKEPERRWASMEDAIGALAAQSLGHDDPVRTQMIELAKTGIKSVARIPVPSSPAPIGKPTPVERGGAPVGAARQPVVPPQMRRRPQGRRGWVWKAVAWGVTVLVLVMVGVGVRHLLRQPAEVQSPAAAAFSLDSVATVEIVGAPDSLVAGEVVQLAASATNVEGAAVSSATIQWASQDSGIATVSSDGLVTAVGTGGGIAVITAEAGGQQDTVRLVVAAAAIAALEIAPASVRLELRQTVQLSLLATDARGRRVVGDARWSSRNAAVATVSGSGKVTGVGLGMTIVAATSEARTASASVTVVPPALAAITIAPASLRLLVGDSARLTAATRDASGRNLSGRSVLWESSDRGIASITLNGVVIGLSPGSATIAATAEGVRSNRATVTIEAPPPAAPGVLQLLITPWANVSIDGRSRGQRDRVEETISAGVAHDVRLEREGFVTVDTAVTLHPGETRLVRIQMRRRP